MASLRGAINRWAHRAERFSGPAIAQTTWSGCGIKVCRTGHNLAGRTRVDRVMALRLSRLRGRGHPSRGPSSSSERHFASKRMAHDTVHECALYESFPRASMQAIDFGSSFRELSPNLKLGSGRSSSSGQVAQCPIHPNAARHAQTLSKCGPASPEATCGRILRTADRWRTDIKASVVS